MSGDDAGGAGKGIGEFLLRCDDAGHAPLQDDPEHRDEQGHDQSDRPGHDPEHHHRPERGHADAQDAPDHGVDQVDEGPGRRLERRDDLAGRAVGVPAMAQVDEVVIAVGDGATNQRRVAPQLSQPPIRPKIVAATRTSA